MTPEEIYQLLALDSFRAAFALTMESEVAFFAMVAFGGYSEIFTVLFALLGSMVGLSLNWLIGWLMVKAGSALSLGEKKENGNFAIFCRNGRRYGKWLLLIHWMEPFGGPITLMAGVVRVPIFPFLALTFVGRLGYYLMGIYLMG